MDATQNQQAGEYRVDLAVFQGPLDLLLYLLKKEELDIYDIPIARITGEYLKYVELMTMLNLDVAGEFILMAATLIRIKTRMLLPRDAADTDEPDPREELIMALIEYKKYKEAGEILHEKALLEERNYVPPPVGETNGTVHLSETTTLFDLLTAFRDVLKNQPTETFHQITPEQVSIEDRILYVMQFLREREFATFREMFADMPIKLVAIVTFIALLELARTRRVTICQSVPFAELRVYRGEDFAAPLRPIDIADYAKLEEQIVG